MLYYTPECDIVVTCITGNWLEGVFMKDIPYSELKKNKRDYDIMILRDQHNNTFTDIAKDYEISSIWVREIYSKIKIKQMQLYIRHISIVLGYENTAEVRKVFEIANECYQGFSYACAYLEKKYKGILDEYRAGEPGVPELFIKKLPPIKRKLSKKMISRIIEMREIEKATYNMIAKEMRITPEKAKHTYDSFYHQKVLKHVEALKRKAKGEDEKWAIVRRYFGEYRSSKKTYEMILKENEEYKI